MIRSISLITIILSLSMMPLCAQNRKDTYRAVYNFEYTKDSVNMVKSKDVLFLELNSDRSFCYSYYTYQTDSLRTSPNGQEVWNQMFRASLAKDGTSAISFPHKRSTFTILKNHKSREIKIKDIIDVDIYEYTIPLDEFEWQIQDSTETILGYTCILATTLYHGRQWEVWFTPDIPLSDGPWQFCGLPGLIIKARDINNLFDFNLSEFRLCNNPIKDWTDNGRKTTRKEFLKRKYKYLKNSTTIFNAEFDTNISNSADTRYLKGLEPDFD